MSPPPPCRESRDASSRSQHTDYSSSSDRSEELRTPDSMDEPWEGGSDGRASPLGGRRYPGVQVMGCGLLAEMKAKQERRAHKVRVGLRGRGRGRRWWWGGPPGPTTTTLELSFL